MAKIKMVVDSISKNVVQFDSVQKTDEANSLTASGRSSYGTASFVVSKEEELANFKVGDVYNFELTKESSEKEEVETES